MAGYSEKDVDTENDWEWQPPSDAEMKIIQARRERSDRISKIMGSYLLKGYKMLASECKKCGTIELEDRTKKIYCVGCEEVDPEIQKDNPALNEKAASSQRAEQKFLNERTEPEKKPEQTATSLHATPNFDQLTSPVQGIAYRAPSDTYTSPSASIEEECAKCIESIHRKMAWARLSLERDTDPNAVAAYLKVITGCVETINTLRKYSC